MPETDRLAEIEPLGGGDLHRGTMPETVRLIEIEPDLARFLPFDDREVVRRLDVPVYTVARGPFDAAEVFADLGAFGAVVLDGIMLHRLQVGSHLTMKLVGPGDLLARTGESGSMLLAGAAITAGQESRLALLGAEFLAAIRRWPALAAGLHARMGEQAERFALQLAICQLPRVDERLMALFWWLAESWGRVTSIGTVVPLALTHDVLGALVGARRPTITLALGELSERGAIVRHDRGWLLTEPPPAADGSALAEIDDPTLVPVRGAEWRNTQPEPVSNAVSPDELIDLVHRLRDEHAEAVERTRERLREMQANRERMLDRRRRSANPRRVPSS